MSTDERLLQLCDLNLAESNREHARFLPPHAIEERDGLLFTASGTRSPAAPFNVAMRVGPDVADAAHLIGAAEAFFSARKRGFSIQVRSHVDRDLIERCEAIGYPRMSGRAPGMVVTERVEAKPVDAHVTSRVIDASNAADFVSVAAQAYEPAGLKPAVTHKVFGQPVRWLAPQWHVRVLCDHEQPVACAMLLFSHGIAGVYWVGTIPSACGKGFAETLTRIITNDAFDHGAHAVTLQASAMGESVYRRIGYREITTYPWYIVLPDRD